MRRNFHLIISCGILFCSALRAEEPADFFESKIRPLLAAKCYACHSVESGKHKGGLQLDTKAALLKGGDTGPALVAGDVGKSLLIKAVQWTDADLRMPPKEKLGAQEIADLEAWIKSGAADPRTGQRALTNIELLIENSKQHWSFKPVAKSAPPANGANPIDAFVIKKLDEAKLALSPPADKRTLIRRAYFDLVGLPPSFADVEAFIADDTPDAFEKVIDKLLADPRYGERWGRHWLDVARYADSMGAIFNGDDAYPYAFTYRDYVIRAFNEDLPYNQFVTEQIAADLLPQNPKDNRNLAALGFLGIGRRKDRNLDDDTLDDTLDVIGRGLMGMTISCARCHDHKLEPITTTDYYGLYAVLKSCKEPQLLPEIVPQAASPAREAFRLENEKARENFVRVHAFEAEKAIAALRGRMGDYLLAAHDGALVDKSKNKNAAAEMLTSRKLSSAVAGFGNWAAWEKANPAVFGPWLELSELPASDFAAKAPALCAKYAANADKKIHELVAHEFTGEPPANLREVADKYNHLFADIDQSWGERFRESLSKLCKLEEQEADILLSDLEIRAIDRTARAEKAVALPASESQAALMAVLNAKDSPYVIDGKAFVANKLYASRDVAEGIRRNAAKAVTDLVNHPGAPLRAMAWRDDKPFEGKVFVRGNPNTKGADAPRQFLTALKSVAPDPFPKDKSGRLELAKAITSDANPLTARVIVNRVWQWHFGEGLVRTPSDFGFRGEAPTHPELLDHLAAWFMENGWSIKKLHTHIMLSAAYRQSSAAPAQERTGTVDPADKLLWSFPVQPLELEPFRDSVLAVSGRLLTETFGKPVKLTDNSPASLRRTIYGFVDRKTLPNLLRSFDFPDPNFSAPKRSRTALTPRALILMNSPLIIDSAKALAATLNKALPDDAARIKELYRRVLQRPPTEKESARALAYLAAYPANDLVQPEAKDWQYGYGEFDALSHQVKEFATLSSFDGKAWKATPKTADGKPASVMLNAQGGDPGPSERLSSIRRWIAPQDGRVNISAELSHMHEKSEGVIARIISKRSGLLGEWKTKNNAVMTDLKDVDIKQGDILDFIVSSASAADPGIYQWAPTIVMPGVSMPGMPGVPKRWDARSDFSDPSKPPKPLSAWEELVQALLLSNEFGMME